ncbi:uncharacterized protein [Amphiura filiformis]|uniref:uncharacterized protein n=1 Tax=Amphiura filiformis TaxID=82378 RepID=UPI003B21707F
MKMNLVVIVASIFITCCNFANSETEDCITLCNQCVEVSDTITHMTCTKHCKDLKLKNDNNISCQQMTALNKGNPSLGDEIKAFNAKVSKLIEGGDYSAIVEEIYTDDCFILFNGYAPGFGKEDTKQVWFAWFESNPSFNRILFTTTAFGESGGYVWEDGIANAYHDDVLVGSWRYMYVYKRVNGNLLLFMDIDF